MPKRENKFSWHSRLKSFAYAGSGLLTFLKKEHNARIHLGLTIVVILLGFILKVSSGEAITLIIAIALVWMAELINTAIEKAMDFISTEKHPQIKWIKDLAAAAVLIAAVSAFIIGCIVFVPKIF
jgi:diacylglycerol kinase